jgi:glyoxylase-like metal-dependent hydrolase (beta-lactamase superfamily II)
VFTGDTLFAGSIGRTDFDGGSMEEMKASLRRLKNLPDHLMVFAGHGGNSLIGQEKRVNPFLNQENSGWMF